MENTVMASIVGLRDVASQTLVALIGVLAALIGTRVLEKEQRKHHLREETRNLNERRLASGHRAMLAVEAQRNFAQRLYDLVKDEPEFVKWPAISVDLGSLPKVDVGELEFLIVGAENKNILPMLLGYQQNADQLQLSLANFGTARQKLEIEHIIESPLKQVYEDELRCIGESLRRTFDNLLSGYSEVQSALHTGLVQVLPGFSPIFQR